MLSRSLIKRVFIQPATPLRARFTTSSPNLSPAKVNATKPESPLFKPPSNPNKLSPQDLTEGTYEKELETSPDPVTTHSGTRSYVVNQPDPANSKYEIPTGAYHSTASYEKVEVKHEAEQGVGEESSTSSELAHPVTTRRGDGGVGHLDKEGTEEGVDWVLEKKT